MAKKDKKLKAAKKAEKKAKKKSGKVYRSDVPPSSNFST
jgi:hypothetical protein